MKSEKKGRLRNWKKQDYNNNNEGGFILSKKAKD